MTQHEKIEQETLKLVTPITDPLGITVYDVEFVREAGSWYLRVYLEKEGGSITVGDCEAVHRPLSDRLDEKDFIEEMYILEVCSMGLGRPVKKDKDFNRNIGRQVEIHLYRKTGDFKDAVGTLLSFDKDTVTVDIEDSTVTIERKNISRISEYVDWDAEKEDQEDE